MKLCLSVVLVLCAFISVAESWTDPATGIAWTYTSQGGSVSVGSGVYRNTAVPKATAGALAIPSFVNGMPVVNINDFAFDGLDQLTSIIIPNGVTNMNYAAFMCCYKLKSIALPPSLLTIGGEAFSGCRELKEITIPANMTFIGSGAFLHCGALDNVTILMSRDAIIRSAYALSDCACLRDDNGFIIIYDILISCPSDSSVVVPEGVTVIAAGVLSSMTKNVSLPSTLKSISSSAFYGRSSLTSIEIPSGVTNIGEKAFCNCSLLEVVSIPRSVTSIGMEAFAGCPTLKFVYVEAGEVERVKAMLFESGYRSSYTEVKDEKFECYFTLRSGYYDTYATLTNVVGSGSIVIDSVMPGFSYSDLYKEVRYNGNGMNVGAVNSSCSFDPAIKEVVLPDTSITIKPRAFKTARNIERLVLRADYRFEEYREGSAIDWMFNRAFEGMSSLKELWCDFSINKDFGVYDHVVSNGGFYGLKYAGAFDYADAVFFPVASSNIWIKLLRNSGYGGHWGCFEGHWPDVKIVAEKDVGNGETVVKDHVKVTVTNVDVKYVLNSVQPQFAIPATYDTGFVNIIAEVKGGCVAVPATWTVNYPKFIEKFGSDFTKALAMQTGKKDGAGNPMFVWQDYVAGTDPTDETDVFTASITIVDGKVKVSYSPELDDARKALRKYTTYGKVKLTDKDWSVVGEGEEGNFNFFKVTVEMK